MKAKITMGERVYEGELVITCAPAPKPPAPTSAHPDYYEWKFYGKGPSILHFLGLPRPCRDGIFTSEKEALADAKAHNITIIEE